MHLVQADKRNPIRGFKPELHLKVLLKYKNLPLKQPLGSAAGATAAAGASSDLPCDTLVLSIRFSLPSSMYMVRHDLVHEICVTDGEHLRGSMKGVMMMSFIVLSETKPFLPTYTCLGSVFATTDER
jgi:hypothetical protein